MPLTTLKIALHVTLALFLAACSSGTPDAPVPVPTDLERVMIENGSTMGIFDPSVATDPLSGRLWMSYSSVNPVDGLPPETIWQVGIRLAYSDDGGITWHDAGVTVAASSIMPVGGPDMDVINPDTAIPENSVGIWQSETSSLVYDPAAPASKHWKIVWHNYLMANSINGFVSYFVDYAWIAYKEAATPEGLASAEAIKLFSGFGLQNDAQITGAPVYAPVGSVPAVRLDSNLTHTAAEADLNELLYRVFAEPGLLATTDALYLSVLSIDVLTKRQDISLFRCAQPCSVTDPGQWVYVGNILGLDDAQAKGYGHYSAPHLFEDNGTAYLIATPVEVKGEATRYDGCSVISFADIDLGRIVRDSSERPVIVREVRGDPALHNGACSAVGGVDDALLLSQFEPANKPETFRIYSAQ